MFPPGSASSASSSTGVRASRHGSPEGAIHRQSSIGSASTLFSDASVDLIASRLGRLRLAREQPRGHVQPEAGQRLRPRLAQLGTEDRWDR